MYPSCEGLVPMARAWPREKLRKTVSLELLVAELAGCERALGNPGALPRRTKSLAKKRVNERESNVEPIKENNDQFYKISIH